ncbi:MAG: D-aminoacyl-tRNA deacylase [Candidatus Bathyarchaeia archaeon]
MILFIASKVDIAGLNIAGKLIELFGFREIGERLFGNPSYSLTLRNLEEARLAFVDDEPVQTQSLPYPKDLRMVIFISRHSSRSRTPTLSVHTPGNIGDAMLGGVPRKVSISPASAMKAALLEMAKARDEMGLPYEVSYECTHHGPSLDLPAIFVELGSSVEQWRDSRAAEAVARGAMAAAVNERIYPAALGLGGQHYNEKFTRMALSGDVAFGHMIPKYALPDLDEYMLRQCVSRVVEPVEKAILDWKGIRGADKENLLRLLKIVGLKIEKV